jgi:glycosyltransferase involved in cell wall biosynthesis
VSNPRLSVVVPCYNEQENLDDFFHRLIPVLEGVGLTWEIVCVNDGSRDDTLAALTAWHGKEPRIKVLGLSRNFGKECALSAGLSEARGDAVVPMDADLQHPPEVIPDMVAKWREGFDVVYAVRKDRVGQSLLSRLQAKAFYWVFDRLCEVPLPREVGDFRLLDRKVLDVINSMPERTRFMKGIFAWVGFRQTGVPYDQEERHHGETKFSVVALLRFAFDGLVAFSDTPLRIGALIGAVISAIAFFYIVVRVVRTILFGIDVPGYESIITIMLFLGGVQLITLGVIGHYLGRVFNEVKGRPLFIIRDKVGFDDEKSP